MMTHREKVFLIIAVVALIGFLFRTSISDTYYNTLDLWNRVIDTDTDKLQVATDDTVVTINNTVTSTLTNIDDNTNALLMIDYGHHEIHEGNHFYVMGSSTLDTGDSLIFVTTTSNTAKWAHMRFTFYGTGGTTFSVIEGGSIRVGGTPVTAINSDRNSDNTSGMTVLSNPTNYNKGATVLETASYGAGGNPNQARGATVGRDDELILKQNETYFWIFVSLADGNVLSARGFWYEHTNN